MCVHELRMQIMMVTGLVVVLAGSEVQLIVTLAESSGKA